MGVFGLTMFVDELKFVSNNSDLSDTGRIWQFYPALRE